MNRVITPDLARRWLESYERSKQMEQSPNRIDSTHDLARQEFDRSVKEQPDRQAEQYTPNACPDCGRTDGMESWYRDEIECLPADLLRDTPWYRLPALPDRIFAQCATCVGDVPAQYERVGLDVVQSWMARR